MPMVIFIGCQLAKFLNVRSQAVNIRALVGKSTWRKPKHTVKFLAHVVLLDDVIQLNQLMKIH